jgi:hypothetical protein
MKIEFPALDSEPLIYFLFHSGAFVAGLSTIFFLLGLWLAWLAWGRYKRNSRRLQEELDRLEDEIISLKRKLAEQAIRPAARPQPLPLPEQTPAFNPALPAMEPAPVLGPVGIGKAVEATATAPEPEPTAERSMIAEAFPNLPTLTMAAGSSGIRKVLVRSPIQSRYVKVPSEPHVPLEDPKPRRFPFTDENAPSGVEPFSFLMGPAPEVAPAARHESPLSAIIAPKVTAEESAPQTETAVEAESESEAEFEAEPDSEERPAAVPRES